jgi:hypothetical protein
MFSYFQPVFSTGYAYVLLAESSPFSSIFGTKAVVALTYHVTNVNVIPCSRQFSSISPLINIRITYISQ